MKLRSLCRGVSAFGALWLLSACLAPTSGGSQSPTSIPGIPGGVPAPIPSIPGSPSPSGGGVGDSRDVFKTTQQQRRGDSGSSGSSGGSSSDSSSGSSGGGDGTSPIPAGGAGVPGGGGGDGTRTDGSSHGSPQTANRADGKGSAPSDGDLDRTLGNIDGTLGSEHGKTADRANTPPSDKGAGDAADAPPDAPQQQKGEQGGPNPGGLPRMPDAPPAPSDVASAGGPNAHPVIVKGARDDDVVARQLREAAEAETDPVLKEKLWDEYRRYNAGR